jgi:hypothetical protein
MFVQLPTAVGVPLSLPLDLLKEAQAGLFAIEKRSLAPSGSEALGLKEYEEPTLTRVAGLPEIVGGRFAACALALKPTMKNRTAQAVAGKPRR